MYTFHLKNKNNNLENNEKKKLNFSFLNLSTLVFMYSFFILVF
jgi:hypothetical protein